MAFIVMMLGAVRFGVGERGFSGVFVGLALKNQGSHPNRLNCREDERGNETRDDCRK
jgi:hypothetical protein